MDIPYIDETALAKLLDWSETVDALEQALVTGGAPGNTPPRSFVKVSSGELILMPGEVAASVGVKVVSVNPASTHLDVPRIQGVHIAFDGSTLTPKAIFDAPGLTTRRTAALSALAVRHLAPSSAASALVFGTGPQALGHILAINAVRPLEAVVVVGRRGAAVDEVVAQANAHGLAARSGTPADVGQVDVVACCTNAETPLFSSESLRPEATVVAVGSHSPTAREVDTALVARATVVVESRESALAQAGDIIMAIAEGVAEAEAISGDLGEMVRGEIPVHSGRPRFFKSVGEAWTDVVVSTAALTRMMRS